MIFSCFVPTSRLISVDFMGDDFNAFSYLYFKTGSQQIAGSLQESSLAVMLRRFDEGINARYQNAYETEPPSTSSGMTSTWRILMSTSSNIAPSEMSHVGSP